MKHEYRRNKKYGYMMLEPVFDIRQDLLWNDIEKKWEARNDENIYMRHMKYEVGIHSIKAAKRHLRKHDEIPKGTRFRLVNWFYAPDVYLTKR